MIALNIIIAIVIIITAILLLRLKLVIEYTDELILYAKVLFIKIRIIPKKEKPVRVSDYTPKKILKRQKKEAEKEKKRLDKKKAKKAQKSERSDTEKKKEKMPILDIIRLVRVLLSIFLKRFFGHLRIDLARLNIIIGSEDAAKTAITYGYVCQSTAYLVEILDNFTNLKKTKNTEISVTTDFLAQSSVIDLHIALSITIWQIFDILFRIAFGYVKNKIQNI